MAVLSSQNNTTGVSLLVTGTGLAGTGISGAAWTCWYWTHWLALDLLDSLVLDSLVLTGLDGTELNGTGIGTSINDCLEAVNNESAILNSSLTNFLRWAIILISMLMKVLLKELAVEVHVGWLKRCYQGL